jgi:hypothetical protein
VTGWLPIGRSVPWARLALRVAEPQLSTGVGAVQVTAAEQVPAAAGTVKFDGKFVRTGAYVSSTVTVKLAVVDWTPSVAV